MAASPSPHTAERRKELGAFYTPAEMAQILADWCIRGPSDSVLDPSFGGLVFLEAAARRLAALGRDHVQIATQIWGVDVDEEALDAAAAADLPGPRADNLLHRDFFAVGPDEIGPFSAVIGNPPYIRYQAFNGDADLAHRRAADAGVSLTRLAASWAPFVVYGVGFVAPGGRYGQVLPAELVHAQYARPVLEYLKASFKRTVLVGFEDRVFPGALEEVVLVLAEGRGEGPGPIEFQTHKDLTALRTGAGSLNAVRQRRPGAKANGHGKLLTQLLSAKTRSAYEACETHACVQPLSSYARVALGAVTGANDFFVLPGDQQAPFDERLLRPTVTKAAHVTAARLTKRRLKELAGRGARCQMFVADAQTDPALLASAESWLAEGIARGIDQRYKCRVREPWWAVPLPTIGVPDLLLTYCADAFPRLAVNEARALHTNTVHGVKLTGSVPPAALAVSFYTSLTMLSCELVGRSYGGGVLKLEPTEAAAVLVAMPSDPQPLVDALPEVDEALAGGNVAAAQDICDRTVLVEGLGLGWDEVLALREGAQRLCARRQQRSRRGPR